MVASIYRPLSVKTFVGLQVISDTFVVKIFDRKSCNSFIFSIVVHSLIHLFCFNTIKRSNICVGDHRNTTDFYNLGFHFVNHLRIIHNQFQF